MLNCLFVIIFLSCLSSSDAGEEILTSTANFGICKDSLFEDNLPTIKMEVEQDPVPICIQQPDKREKGNPNKNDPCGSTPDKMCLASYFLQDYKFPLFSAIHLTEVLEKAPSRVSTTFCKQALTVEGKVYPWKKYKIWDWAIDKNKDKDVFERGHLVPSQLGAQVNDQTMRATFNVFNAIFQYEKTNKAITGAEDQSVVFARNCLDFKLTGIKQDFYFVTGNLPTDKEFEKGKEEEMVMLSESGEPFEIGKEISKEEKEKGFKIPYLQWTAMCCVLNFGSEGIATAGGYFVINRVTESEPLEPKKITHPKDMLSISDLKEKLAEKSDKRADNKIQFLNIFGSSPCEKAGSKEDHENVLKAYLVEHQTKLKPEELEKFTGISEFIKKMDS